MNKEVDFLELLNEHRGIIEKIARLYADNQIDREDLVQEIKYQLWRSYASFKGESKLGTWVYRVALNTALARFRRKQPKLIFPDKMPDKAEQEGFKKEEQRAQLFHAIRQLGPGERALIALYLEGISHRQIADILGTSENNVGVKLHRSKQKLKELLNN